MFIKMADQIHNISTMDIFPLEKKIRKIDELETYFIPIYKKSRELITPMYMSKYENILQGLCEELERAKKKFNI